MKAELSVGLLPSNKNKYIVVNNSTGEEMCINGGVSFRAIDKNGERHNIGCILSADYFFKLITNALDDDNKKWALTNTPVWGADSEFSSKSLEESAKKGWEKFMNEVKK